MTHAIIRHAIVVTGTDTGIGKTVFAAGLAGALDGFFWKPVQAGIEGATDNQTVARLSGLPEGRILKEAWLLRTPASPHLAAALEGVEINPDLINPPALPRPLVIEGAGGVMVPLNRRRTYLDLFARWNLPTVLCARTRLGTINHTLLSLAALRDRGIPVLGVAFIGDPAPDTESIIAELGRVRVLGRMPRLARLNSLTVPAAFHEGFSMDHFRI
ncbi:dethiobiotin synthase [Paracoccus lutimaris]|uniref:ATP-dependent dethiobiotin synthetase BioD n=1 Tax=Paracoccus lutimaris TaxID=1490030 RepID=A0A368Z418_9RHOB|nr:dethiobiotin synthase [Paracoccus lutimaris]RCW87161.1 dethiobiotin synthetase [Paracoccus lutimaris]